MSAKNIRRQLCEADEIFSWTTTYKRRHASKFPADDKIPKDAKKAVANVLKIDSDKLETYLGFDEIEGQEVFILQDKN